MNCKYCNVPMVLGEAIKPAIDCDSRAIVPTAPIKFKDLEVIPVLKCPACGHSEHVE